MNLHICVKSFLWTYFTNVYLLLIERHTNTGNNEEHARLNRPARNYDEVSETIMENQKYVCVMDLTVQTI